MWGQSSQVHRGSGIHILKISSNFYILLVLLIGANPENFSSILLFVQIFWPSEYFMVRLIFLVMQLFSILGSIYQKFSKLLSSGRYSLKYMPRLLQDTRKSEKKLKTESRKSNFDFSFLFFF